MDYKPRFNTRKLEEEQVRLSKKIINRDAPDFSNIASIKTIAGCSQAIVGRKIISAIVVCYYSTLEILEKKYAIVEARIPYIPGFLGFRESPAVIEAYSKLTAEPDVLLVEGHGILHPRRFGFASQVGLSLSKPTIGVAKSLLIGESNEGNVYVDNELRGKEIVTREFARPIYISSGHLISLKTACEVVRNCNRPPHKLPEPLHIAGRYADKIREREMQGEAQRKEQKSKFAAESPQKKAAGMLFNF